MNYDARRILTQEEKDELIKAINEDRIQSFDYVNEEGEDVSSNDLGLRLHLGKKSYGWRILLDHNNWDFYHDAKSMISFLKENNYTITNEEEEEIPIEEFALKIEEWNKEGKETGSDYKANFCWDTDFC